jgi:hypothetical protein
MDSLFLYQLSKLSIALLMASLTDVMADSYKAPMRICKLEVFKQITIIHLSHKSLEMQVHVKNMVEPSKSHPLKIFNKEIVNSLLINLIMAQFQ